MGVLVTRIEVGKYDEEIAIWYVQLFKSIFGLVSKVTRMNAR